MDSNGTSVVGWTALIIALIALALAWVAFNRTGTDIEAIVEQRVDDATVEMREDYSELEARFRANTAESLNEAAEDVDNDQQPNNVGE